MSRTCRQRVEKPGLSAVSRLLELQSCRFAGVRWAVTHTGTGNF